MKGLRTIIEKIADSVSRAIVFSQKPLNVFMFQRCQRVSSFADPSASFQNEPPDRKIFK